MRRILHVRPGQVTSEESLGQKCDKQEVSSTLHENVKCEEVQPFGGFVRRQVTGAVATGVFVWWRSKV